MTHCVLYGFTVGPISPDQDICIADMSWYIAIQNYYNPVNQHDIASYVTKFESQSFRLRSNFGVAFAQQDCASSSLRLSQSQGQGQTLAILFELVSRLLCCAYASYITENKGLLTEQALLLSKESLFRQQAFGPSCANALVLCLLLH